MINDDFALIDVSVGSVVLLVGEDCDVTRDSSPLLYGRDCSMFIEIAGDRRSCMPAISKQVTRELA